MDVMDTIIENKSGLPEKNKYEEDPLEGEDESVSLDSTHFTEGSEEVLEDDEDDQYFIPLEIIRAFESSDTEKHANHTPVEGMINISTAHDKDRPHSVRGFGRQRRDSGFVFRLSNSSARSEDEPSTNTSLASVGKAELLPAMPHL